jgi:predicted nucleic acid-binding protein
VVLVDTSVWVELFRKQTRFKLESVVSTDDIVTCLPVVQEVLQGFRDERAFALARDAMFSFPVVESPLRAEVVLEAAGLYRSARRAGLTIRSGVDCLIAACAIRNGLSVLHQDRDFELIARIASLESRDIRS